MNVFTEVRRFFTDRKLNEMEFDTLNFQGNVLEELFELAGYDVPKENRVNLKRSFEIYTQTLHGGGVINFIGKPSEHDEVDAINDIVVFCQDGLGKKGYDGAMTLAETAKEINSREGSIVDGKFEKDLSPEAKAKWYQANYTHCKY